MLDVQAQIGEAKAAARASYDLMVARLEAAYGAGLADAEAAYKAELDRIDRLGRMALEAVFVGGGEGGQATAPSSVIPVRPPTWKEAVLAVMAAGPYDGMHADDILGAVMAMGVTTSAKDPNLVLDATFHALSSEIVRVGRRRWMLRNHPESSSPETSA